MPTRLRLSCHALLIIVLVRSNFSWAPPLPLARSGPVSCDVNTTPNSAIIIKVDGDFPELWSLMYCHLLCFTVYMYSSADTATRRNNQVVPCLPEIKQRRNTSPERSVALIYAKMRFGWDSAPAEELKTHPRPPSRLGKTPFPYPTPIGAFSASIWGRNAPKHFL